MSIKFIPVYFYNSKIEAAGFFSVQGYSAPHPRRQ